MWAWSSEEGWVVLDKGLAQNRLTDYPEEFQFIRCADWSAYEQGEATWSYREAQRFLKSLPAAEAWEKEGERLKLMNEFETRRYEIAA